ncbi:MAG: hypothetical protein AB7V42_08635 [Thermoleophilia bacterium]
MSERSEIERRWREGEDRLYPVATVRPDLYQAVIGLVRSLADHLESVPDTDALVATYRATTIDAEAAAAGIERGSVPPEVDLGMVRDAAYKLRSRELAVREASEGTRRAIDRARAAGDRTAVIWSEGDREQWPPYRRVEMSMRTGYAVSVSTHLDPETMTPRFALEAFELDPDTGEATGSEPLAARRDFTDPDQWRAAAKDLRDRLLTT